MQSVSGGEIFKACALNVGKNTIQIRVGSNGYLSVNPDTGNPLADVSTGKAFEYGVVCMESQDEINILQAGWGGAFESHFIFDEKSGFYICSKVPKIWIISIANQNPEMKNMLSHMGYCITQSWDEAENNGTPSYHRSINFFTFGDDGEMAIHSRYFPNGLNSISTFEARTSCFEGDGLQTKRRVLDYVAYLFEGKVKSIHSSKIPGLKPIKNAEDYLNLDYYKECEDGVFRRYYRTNDSVIFNGDVYEMHKTVQEIHNQCREHLTDAFPGKYPFEDNLFSYEGKRTNLDFEFAVWIKTTYPDFTV